MFYNKSKVYKIYTIPYKIYLYIIYATMPILECIKKDHSLEWSLISLEGVAYTSV